MAKDKGMVAGNMSLRDQRIKFSILFAKFILWANEQKGWEVAIGRDFDEGNESLRHKKTSLHYLGLANDIALYIDGIYQDKTEAYERAGMFWKSLDLDCRWGGDFKDKKGKPAPDGNHVSIAWEGRA